jgi:hypothetical protein
MWMQSQPHRANLLNPRWRQTLDVTIVTADIGVHS